jgi:hypothetical protein
MRKLVHLFTIRSQKSRRGNQLCQRRATKIVIVIAKPIVNPPADKDTENHRTNEKSESWDWLEQYHPQLLTSGHGDARQQLRRDFREFILTDLD